MGAIGSKCPSGHTIIIAIHRSIKITEERLCLVTVATYHKLTNMAAISEASDSLERVAGYLSIEFLPDYKQIADRKMNRALNYFTQGYIHNIKCSVIKFKVLVMAKCWRSKIEEKREIGKQENRLSWSC